MSDHFELTNDLSKKELKKLKLKLCPSAPKNSNSQAIKNCGSIAKLNKIYKNALKRKFLVFESTGR